ncbi:MAG: flagellar motor protein MotB [Bacteroidetes bacterium]|nr:flagellar motor protein MotB [Bacteroidota bacterium]
MKTALLILYCTFCILGFVFCAAGQPYDPSKVNKKAVALYTQAQERAEDENYISAAGLLLQAVEIDKNYVDAWLALGSVYATLKNYNSSAGYFEKAFALDSAYTINFKFTYAHQLAGLGQFEKALAAIHELFAKAPPKNATRLKEAEARRRSYEFAVNYAKNNRDTSYVFAPQNMGSAVNSGESEYFPSLTIDGNDLVFTRKLSGDNEDFFSCTKKTSGDWDIAKPVTGINTSLSEGAQHISSDGGWLVFTGCYRPDGFGSCDIYISYKTPGGWTTPENMGRLINSDQWESQPCLSPDKRDLYFASKRLGGYGGSDIYVSHLQPNGSWGYPQNLGPGINTPGDEQCPFIHADNQTLYFTSSQWQGYGDEDLFYARKQRDGRWSTPVNLGYPINTIDREGTLFIAADGKTAYYASDRSDSKGGLDLYSFELRESIRPFKTLWVKGKVFDKKTRTGLVSSVELIDLAGQQVISKTETDDAGNYFITLPVGKDYAFVVNRKGYLFYSDNFWMAGHSPDSTYQKDIPLTPIEINASIVLKNIFFDINKWELKPESQAELDKLVQLLHENPSLKIEISGHTDNVGGPADNLTLSNNRAKAVVNYLISKNIAVSRLNSKGFGETRPVADNKTEEGRAQNRRTEMKVMSQ